MTAGTANLLCDQGSTFTTTVAWTNAGGTAINLTGYNARMDVRFAQTKEADLVLQLTQANGRCTVPSGDKSTGIFTLKVSAADTAALTAGTYYYDLEVFSVDSTSPVYVQRLIQGKFTVKPEVTG